MLMAKSFKCSCFVLFLTAIALQTFMALQYRYLKNQTLSFSPDFMQQYQFESNSYIAKIGKNVTIYNTETKKMSPVYQIEEGQNDEKIQYSNMLGMFVYKNNNMLNQVQTQNNKAYYMNYSSIDYLLSLSTSGQYLIWNFLTNSRTRSYFRACKFYTKTCILTDNSRYQGNIAGGSEAVFISDNQFYLLSGGLYNAATNKLSFYLYRGLKTAQSSPKLINITFLAPFQTQILQRAQKFQLKISTNSASYTKFAITYHFNQNTSHKSSITCILTLQSSSQIYQPDRYPFKIQGLIGLDFSSSSADVMYSADTQLCRITQHTLDNYKIYNFYTTYYLRNQVITMSVVSEDEKFVLVCTDVSKAYLLDSKNSQGYMQLKTTVYFDYKIIAKKAYIVYTNALYLPVLVFLTQNGQLYTLKSGSSRLTYVNYTDICLIHDEFMYIVRTQQGQSFLSLYKFYQSMDRYEQFTVELEFVPKSLLCLPDNTVLLTPLNQGDQFQVWGYDSVQKKGILLAKTKKLEKIHQQAFRTDTMIYFRHSDNQTSPIFYDFRLNVINLKNPIHIASHQTYRLIPTNNQQILIAIGTSQNKMAIIDLYKIQQQILSYKGSYPLNQHLFTNNTPNLNTIKSFSKKQLFSIDYTGQGQQIYTYVYNLEKAPSNFYGHFLDKSSKLCSRYTQALYRTSPSTGQKQIILLNQIDQHYQIQTHIFNGSLETIQIDQQLLGFDVRQKLEMSFSKGEMREYLVISGEKQISDHKNSQSLQIRLSENLSTLILQKNYSQLNSQQRIFSYSLQKHNLFTSFQANLGQSIKSTVTSTPINNKSLDLPSNFDVDLISVARSSNVAAFTSVSQPNQILLYDLLAQKITSNITAQCSVKLLRCYVGKLYGRITGVLLLAYSCQNGSLFIYDKKNHYHQGVFDKIEDIQLNVDTEYNFWILVKNGQGEVKLMTVLFNNSMGNTSQNKIQNIGAVQKKLNQQVGVSNSIAINRNFNIYAYIASPHNVLLFDSQNKLISNFTLSQIQQQSHIFKSLFFNNKANKNLILLTSQNTLVQLTSYSCPQNLTNSNSYCVCLPTYIKITDNECACPETYSQFGKKCRCNSKQYEDLYAMRCQQCSFMCERCEKSGLFSCVQYNVLFVVLTAVIAIGLLVLLVFIGRKVVIRWRGKRNQRLLQQQNEQDSNLTNSGNIRKNDQEKI